MILNWFDSKSEKDMWKGDPTDGWRRLTASRNPLADPKRLLCSQSARSRRTAHCPAADPLIWFQISQIRAASAAFTCFCRKRVQKVIEKNLNVCIQPLNQSYVLFRLCRLLSRNMCRAGPSWRKVASLQVFVLFFCSAPTYFQIFANFLNSDHQKSNLVENCSRFWAQEKTGPRRTP